MLQDCSSDVAPGTYDVRIRDAANPACVIILNAGLQITEPAALMAMVIDTDITCFGAMMALFQLQIQPEATEHSSIALTEDQHGRIHLYSLHFQPVHMMSG